METVIEGSERFQMLHSVLHVQCSAVLQKQGYVFALDYVRDHVLCRLVQQERHRLLLFVTFADGAAINEACEVKYQAISRVVPSRRLPKWLSLLSVRCHNHQRSGRLIRCIVKPLKLDSG